jgi:hypothetical protein
MEECLIENEATVDAKVINNEGWRKEHRLENARPSSMAIITN